MMNLLTGQHEGLPTLSPEYMLAKYVSEDQFKLYITLCSNIVCFFYAVAVLMLSLG